MACPSCGSNRTIANGGGRRACLSPDHKTGPRYYKATEEISEQERSAMLCARQGVAPEQGLNYPLPPGQKLKGVSTLTRNADGDIQWIKSTEDSERWQAYVEATLAGMVDKIQPAKPVTPPKSTNDELLNLYVISDYHLGMLAWPEETGDEWDIKIAEQMLLDWFSAAIAMSPDADTGVFLLLGDFRHWDGLESVTPAHRHVLDADTRFQKMIRASIHIKRQVIAMLLAKHQRVHVIDAEGNHDPATSSQAREWLHAMYADEPRLTVDRSPDPYYCVEHGEVAIFAHHGHLTKLKDVDSTLVAKFREVYGRTKRHYAHMGHLHHIDVKETNLMVVEQHRTLAGKDAYASRGGFMSGREASVITYHKRFGRVSTVTITPEMLR